MFKHVTAEFPTKGRKAKIAFIADAPGDEEIRENHPLVGPSGRIFNSIMRTAGIDREECLVTYVFDEKPDDDDVVPWLKDEVRVADNFARLKAEIDRAKPNVIVPLGSTALWAFTGQTSISSYRGAVSAATRIVPGAKLVPTFPADLIMRQWKLLPVVVGDFIKAAREAERGPEIIYPHIDLYIPETIEEVDAFCTECLNAERLTCDIETGWGQITCIGLAPSADKAMCIPFIDPRSVDKSYWPTDEAEFLAWKAVAKVLASPVKKIFQNGLYDVFWLWYVYRLPVYGYDEDTRIMHHVLYPELAKSLEQMAASYTDIGVYKIWGHHRTEKRDA